MSCHVCNVTLVGALLGGAAWHCIDVTGVSSAYAAILTIVETTVEEFRLSDESITCLLMDKALRVNQLQTKHAVRTTIHPFIDGLIGGLID